ncbi:MAG: 1-acyl-sn-glycerol-3-phosphate acyltransferase [Deltaproteobacteria bacterium]|nr:1-acyl-sn-glycerol-3-phosphate acyltransferase [Deltaproteobacteria bacterium]
MRRWVRRGAIEFIRRYRIQLESIRFIDRVWIRERLALDPEIDETVLEVARQTGEPIAALRMRVDEYVEEIAPYFSVTAYYRTGAWLAKRLVDFCFELVVDPDGYERQAAQVPEGAIRVYVINHRSNTDAVVLAYSLLRRTPLSYAVGEWALIWPLHTLFRMFGSYFVRRGEQDPVYRVVLERFVQILTGHGGVTGFFIEGGLSRDGALREPRIGLLDYLVRVRREHPDRDMVFLPVGLNYDRVLEDRNLVAERDGPLPRRGFYRRMLNLAGIAFWLPLLVGANLLKVATRSHQKFGYAAITFGKPLRLTEWPGGATMHLLGDEERREAVEALAHELLVNRVGAVVPVTPVPVLCEALVRTGDAPTHRVRRAVREVLGELRALEVPIALGQAFEALRTRRAWAEGEGELGVAERLDREEADLVLLLATNTMTRRRVLLQWGTELRVVPGEEPIVEYYANSIRHHFERQES